MWNLQHLTEPVTYVARRIPNTGAFGDEFTSIVLVTDKGSGELFLHGALSTDPLTMAQWRALILDLHARTGATRFTAHRGRWVVEYTYENGVLSVRRVSKLTERVSSMEDK